MIGGRIKKTYQLPDRVSIWVVDTNGDELAIDVIKDDSIKMLPGDQIWWQARKALWTASTGIAIEDVPIDRIGYSYSVIGLQRNLCKAGICPDCGYTPCMADGHGRLWCPRCDASIDLSE